MNETDLIEPDETTANENVETNSETLPNSNLLTRPDGLPDKFWDQKTGAVRVDTLAKSYQELERKLGGGEIDTVPESPEDYAVTINGEAVETDAEVNSRLHAAGLSPSQVQTVYELANEKLVPIVNSMSSTFEAESQVERLKNYFGGDEKWDQVKRQISTWGRENFTDDVFDALSSTYEGVLTMRRMMSSNEPGLGPSNTIGNGLNETTLKGMMADPRYWRQRDPAFIERVRQGFRDLYPDS